ncbi:MAG: uridine kinase [Bacilli bacterium]|nr:uridine kinase [Bacilli bacterium]MCH4236259.1 uridine kinase [Bacilli bacterium]
MSKVFVIGIAGGTASGKTTLAENLFTQSECDTTLLLRLDNYYRDFPDMPLEQRQKLNYDTPESFDVPLIVKHLKALKAGKEVEIPSYDFSFHRRKEETVKVKTTPVIIVEGIMVFAIKEIRDLLDFKIFVDTPADVRLLRRIQRDINERGRTLSSVANQYLSTVRPMHDLYVEPSKVYANIIIPEGGYNKEATDLLVARIRQMVEENH